MPSPEEAERLAQAMSTCPYSIAVGTSGDQFYNILVVPRTKMWWLEYPRDKPDIIGAISVDIATIDNLVSAVRFRQKDARISRKAPCGADCEDCGLRVQFQCRGCPATTPYR
ncbi:MAG: hypothetical protein C4K47_07510 [Candidatus Thorarchaeota archaeon]|nr:MAG: hypothetical protein C4K47_07510 [Candidatus Thorarchaeota archaeon]